MMKRIALALSALSLLFLPVVALAQEVVAPALEDLGDLVVKAYAAIQRGDTTTAAVIGVMVIVGVVINVGGKFIPALKTDKVGTLLSAILAPLALLSPLVANGVVTPDAVKGAVETGLLAGGGWAALSRLIIGALLPYAIAGVRKIPAVGTVAVPFVEGLLGRILRGVRDEVLKRLRRKEPVARPDVGVVAVTATALSSEQRAPAIAGLPPTADEARASTAPVVFHLPNKTTAELDAARTEGE